MGTAGGGFSVEPRLLQQMRGALAELGVEVTPSQLFRVMRQLVGVAEVLATRQVGLVVGEDVELWVDLERQEAGLLIWDKEQA